MLNACFGYMGFYSLPFMSGAFRAIKCYLPRILSSSMCRHIKVPSYSLYFLLFCTSQVCSRMWIYPKILSASYLLNVFLKILFICSRSSFFIFSLIFLLSFDSFLCLLASINLRSIWIKLI